MPERLVYVSRTAPQVGEHVLRDIARAAAERHRATHLTGMLLFIDGHVLQVLEGHAFEVQRCFARIAADARHRELSLRQVIALSGRSFPGQGMAWCAPARIDADLRRRHRYRPGFPIEDFDGDALVAFARDAWQGQAVVAA